MTEYSPLGERIPFERVRKIRARHPDAPDRLDVDTSALDRNLVLVGAAGTGKSIAMRQMCAELANNASIYPIYVHAERWLALPLSESIGRNNLSSTRGTAVRANATSLLALGIVRRIAKLRGTDIARRAARALPEPPSAGADFEQWLAASINRAQIAARNARLAIDDDARPDLRMVLESVSEALSAEIGKRPVYFIDQLDKVHPVYFDLLERALGRTEEYNIVVATRPSPCAPEATQLQTRVGDCHIAWLGTNPSDPLWGRFLVETSKEWFGSAISQKLASHAAYLSQVVGPGTRQFLEVAHRLAVSDRTITDEAILAATKAMKSNWLEEARRSLATYDNSLRFMSSISKLYSGETGQRSLVVADPGLQEDLLLGGLLGARATGRLRVGVREGIFLPSDTEAYGIDGPANEFIVVPMDVTDKEIVGPRSSLDPASRVISEEEFVKWGNRVGGFGSGSSEPVRKPKIFYSHWMDAQNGQSELVIRSLRDRLGFAAEITIGATSQSPNLADSIRAKIGEASLIVVQLDALRPAIGLEVGWAMAMDKVLVFALGDASKVNATPEWLTTSEIQFNGTDSERESFAKHLLAQLNDLDLDVQTRTGSRDIADHQRMLGELMIVGSGQSLAECKARARDLLQSVDLRVSRVVDTSQAGSGRALDALVAHARNATCLVGALSGNLHADLLTHVAIGSHTFRATDQRVPRPGGGRRVIAVARAPFVYSPKAVDAFVSRPLILGIKGAVVGTRVADVVDGAVQQLSDIRRRLVTK